MTLSIVGFDDLVTSFVATVATGWSDPCRVGLSPTERPRLSRRTEYAAWDQPEQDAASVLTVSTLTVSSRTARATLFCLSNSARRRLISSADSRSMLQ